MMASTPSEKKGPNPPFKQFFPNISFVTSVLTNVCINVSISLSTQTTSLGRSDAETQRRIYSSAGLFAWAGCANGIALMLSLMMQLLYTSPHFEEFSVTPPHKNRLRWALGAAGWISLAFAASGIALAAEGLKLINTRAGAVLQWLLLGFGLPVLSLFLGVRISQKGTCWTVVYRSFS